MPSDYPSPKYPKFKPISRAEIRRRISSYVNAMQKRRDKESGMRFPAYDIKNGDRVLVAAATENDHDVMSGYVEAFKELGARVDLLYRDLGTFPAELTAAQEAENLIVGYDNPAYTSFCNVITGEMARALVKAEGYNKIVAGTAGPLPLNVPARWHRAPFICVEDIASPAVDFPLDLQLLIDRKVYDQVMSIEKAHLTDPEGTDITWTNYDDKRVISLSHEMGKPCNIGVGGKPDCSGVIAGTLNHMGVFPHLKAYLKDDLVVKVAGGGKFGEVWKEKIEELNNLELPPVPMNFTKKSGAREPEDKYRLPGPGFFWYWEMAIGTKVGTFRTKREAELRCFANFLHDRLRSGYIHSGFGAPSAGIVELTERNVPWIHVHVHSQFATFEGKTRDGSNVKVIDKGHLTALDDEELRKTASKYGDADSMLTEVWVPAVPGINVEGDYFNDYANDPVSWFRKDSMNYNEVEITA